MGYAAPQGSASACRRAALAITALLGAALALAWASQPAAAAPLVGKDGRIHACYKVKGKAKGTLRVVRSAKARCPRRWKKVAWNASGQSGAAGEPGSSGENGQAGENGQGGAKGDAGAQGTAAKVSSLESQVTELLTKVKSLESVLAGITNANLKEAIGAVPVVAALCDQTKSLNGQTAALGTALSGLSTVVDTLTLLGLPTVPAALPAFECP